MGYAPFYSDEHDDGVHKKSSIGDIICESQTTLPSPPKLEI